MLTNHFPFFFIRQTATLKQFLAEKRASDAEVTRLQGECAASTHALGALQATLERVRADLDAARTKVAQLTAAQHDAMAESGENARAKAAEIKALNEKMAAARSASDKDKTEAAAKVDALAAEKAQLATQLEQVRPCLFLRL